LDNARNDPATQAPARPDPKETQAVRYLNVLFLLLLIVGGLNWLLVGLFKFDLVAALTGNTFGQTNTLSTIVYALVGISAIGLVPTLLRWLQADERAL
jgi:uncharacterized membrane protein YuzA (DUF378 family)